MCIDFLIQKVPDQCHPQCCIPAKDETSLHHEITKHIRLPTLLIPLLTGRLPKVCEVESSVAEVLGNVILTLQRDCCCVRWTEWDGDAQGRVEILVFQQLHDLTGVASMVEFGIEVAECFGVDIELDLQRPLMTPSCACFHLLFQIHHALSQYLIFTPPSPSFMLRILHDFSRTFKSSKFFRQRLEFLALCIIHDKPRNPVSVINQLCDRIPKVCIRPLYPREHFSFRGGVASCIRPLLIWMDVQAQGSVLPLYLFDGSI